MVARNHELSLRCIPLLWLVSGLTPAQRKAAPPPARLPSYEDLAPVAPSDASSLCSEHSQPVIRKTVLRGVHAGRQYWACANEIPCGHFEWCEQASRLAGDVGQQANRGVPPRWTETLNGTVSRILYRGDGGFTVARVRPGMVQPAEHLTSSDEAAAVGKGEAVPLENGRPSAATVGVRAVACLATARVGDEVRLGGFWTTHARYGRQFDAVEAFPVPPPPKRQAVDAFAAWLGSGVVPNVGTATAAKIVSGLGSRAEEVLARFAAAVASGARDDDAEAMLATAFGWNDKPSISPALVARIASKVADFAASRATVMHLVEHFGMPLDAAFALERVHNEKAAARFRDDPHGALMAARGWGFRRADNVALATNCSKPDSRLRARYGLVHTLAETAASGHCAATQDKLLDLTQNELGPLATRDYTPSRAALETALDMCLGAKQIMRVGDLLFTSWLDRAEEIIAKVVVDRVRHRRSPQAATDNVLTQVAESAPLSTEQRSAVIAAAREPLYIVCGGPGTGKTHAARNVVGAWRAANPSVIVALAAPTARGAAALGESIGERATTIHRLLEFCPRLGDFARDANRQLEIDAIVIDEVSMLDVPLAARLFAAIPNTAAILLVGDPDQLPSIGPGALLRDLLNVVGDKGEPIVPRSTLTRIFRISSSEADEQFDASNIASDARSINLGKPPSCTRPFLELEDGRIPDGSVFLDVQGHNATMAKVALVDAVRRLANAGFDPLSDMQVLAPMKGGEAGVDALNLALQEVFNPTTSADGPVRVRDRVIQLTNDYDTGVFNGDVGLVENVMRNGSFIVNFKVGLKVARVMYRPKDLGDSVALAYALTVHKAQGNEYPVVLLPIVADHFQMLRRALLYTAASRAKRLLVFVGNPDLLAQAVLRDSERKDSRVTGLALRIRNHLQPQKRTLAHLVTPSSAERPVTAAQLNSPVPVTCRALRSPTQDTDATPTASVPQIRVPSPTVTTSPAHTRPDSDRPSDYR